MLQQQHLRRAVTGDLICLKALDFAQQMHIIEPPKFSHGWLDKFKEQHQFRGIYMHDEAGSAPEVLKETLASIRAKCQQYAPEDHYNMDETGLF